MKTQLTQELVRQYLDYDPETGALTWRVRASSKVWVGKPAGYDNAPAGGKRQVQVGLLGGLYPAARLIWLRQTGAWPIGEVDHEDGDHTNQRWNNLRDITPQANIQNQRRAQADNKSSGLLGVTWSKKVRRWQASITVNKKAKWLGYHDTPELAQQAYINAKRQLHAGCTI